MCGFPLILELMSVCGNNRIVVIRRDDCKQIVHIVLFIHRAYIYHGTFLSCEGPEFSLADILLSL